jgi:hypothetical protein
VRFLASSWRRRRSDDQQSVGWDEAEHIGCNFADEISIGWFGGEQRHITLELLQLGFKLFYISADTFGTFLKAGPRVQTMFARDRVLGKISSDEQATEHDNWHAPLQAAAAG